MMRQRFFGIGAAIAIGLTGVMLVGASAAQAQTARERCEKGTGDARIAACTEVIKSDAKAAWAYNNRGVEWDIKGEHDKAIADFGRAIRLTPQESDIYVSRGIAYRSRNELDKSINDYNTAIKIDPNNAIALNNRGNIWFDKGEMDKAIADYDKALRIDPARTTAIANRKLALEERARRLAESPTLQAPQPQIAVAPTPQPAATRQHCTAGKGDTGIAACTEIINRDAQAAWAYLARGLLWSEKDESDKAISDFTAAISINPNDANAFHDRGVEWLRKDEIDRAIDDLRTALRLKPNFDSANFNLGAALQRRPRQPAAVAATPAPAPLVSPQRPEVARVEPTPAPQLAPAPVAQPQGKRVALVIGNGGYRHAPVLENPMRDAALLATSLRSTGFQSVTVKTDLTHAQTLQALKDFANEADEAEWAVVYYAGHGIEFGGANYVIPIDAQLRADRDIDLEAINIGQVLNAIEGAKRLRLVILDACRDNPFANRMRRTMASRSLGRGLGRVEPDVGTLVVYAAKHGEVALDGQGQNSPFATALARRIAERPARDVRRLFDLVRDDVMAATNRRQQPFQYGSLTGAEDFYFVR